MRFDIYKDEQLAARLEYGAPPQYYGGSGREIAALLAATRMVYNLWTAESSPPPLLERADWWAAQIFSAPLARSGYRLRPVWRRSRASEDQPLRLVF
jgi:hypothetical protein